MNVLSELYTPQLLTIGGIDADTNLIGSVMSVKLMERVQNTTVERGMRRKMVASNIENIAGVSTAIYWIANRQTMRTKYDINKGTTLDRSSGQYVTVNLDQMLNKKFILEKYDQERWQTGDVNLRDGLAQRWIDWIMDSVDANVEGLFMRGAIQYNYAVYPTNPNSLLFMDLHNINNWPSPTNVLCNCRRNG